jgi:hypothetical protein
MAGDETPPLSLDARRSAFGCVLALWTLTAAPLWLIRILLAGGPVAGFRFVTAEAMSGRWVEISLLLSLPMLTVIPLWNAAESAHRCERRGSIDLPATFE